MISVISDTLHRLELPVSAQHVLQNGNCMKYCWKCGARLASCSKMFCIAMIKSKGWIALKWQILWETNKFQVSFCSPFKYVRRFLVENKKKRATANNKGADQPARTRRLTCAFVVRTYIKVGFLSDSRHRSSTSCTTFVWTALQWRTNIHILKHWVYFCARMNTKLNSSQSHFL